MTTRNELEAKCPCTELAAGKVLKKPTVYKAHGTFLLKAIPTVKFYGWPVINVQVHRERVMDHCHTEYVSTSKIRPLARAACRRLQ